MNAQCLLCCIPRLSFGQFDLPNLCLGLLLCPLDSAVHKIRPQPRTTKTIGLDQNITAARQATRGNRYRIEAKIIAGRKFTVRHVTILRVVPEIPVKDAQLASVNVAGRIVLKCLSLFDQQPINPSGSTTPNSPLDFENANIRSSSRRSEVITSKRRA